MWYEEVITGGEERRGGEEMDSMKQRKWGVGEEKKV